MHRGRGSTHSHICSSQASFDKQANGAGIAGNSVSPVPLQQKVPLECESLLPSTATRTAASLTPGHSKSYSDNTVYFTPRIVSSQASKAFLASSVLPEDAGNSHRIPAPLWQELQVAAEDAAIVQNANGIDWLLGEGSSGKVP